MELVLCHCLLRSCGWRVLCKLEMTLYSSQSNQLPCRYDIETKIMIDSIQTVQLLGQIGTQMPSHGEFWINNLRGALYKISVTSFPIMGRPNRFLGAIAIFWKIKEK